MLRRLTMISLAAAAMAGPAAAQSGPTFDPLAPCGELLGEGSAIPALGIGFWAFGFLDAATEESHSVDGARLETMLNVLRSECAAAPGTRMVDLTLRLSASQASKEPAVAEAGRTLLMRFFDPAEDRLALTQSLRPTAEDVRAVYGEPLATAMIEGYEEVFTPDAVIQPKPEHTQLLSTFTTTGRLKARDPVLDEFPGGYKDVLDHIVGDVPIGRFKFVEEGETLGLAFDGLVFVNDRWVFMPKPWRMLPAKEE